MIIQMQIVLQIRGIVEAVGLLVLMGELSKIYAILLTHSSVSFCTLCAVICKYMKSDKC